MNNKIVAIIIVLVALALVIDCPILKPWFGFRKPKDSKGRWFE